MTIRMKVIGLAWVIFALAAHGACRSSKTVAEKSAILHGTIARLIHVDSEHGDLNGVFSPKVVYDLYLDVKSSEFKKVKLLVTEKTEVREQMPNGNLQKVDIDSFRGGDELEATVSNTDSRYTYPEATATKIVILQRH